MQLLYLTTLFAAATTAYQFKACSRTSLNGKCDVKTSGGKQTGTYKSYSWLGTRSNYCVRVCKGCTSLGYRCEDYSNNNIDFNKFIIFNWNGGKGPDSSSCC